MALPATDNCTRSNENPLGGNWSTLSPLGDPQLSSNAIKAAAVPGGAYWNADTTGADCSLQITLGAAPTSYIQAFIRFDVSGINGYALRLSPGGWAYTVITGGAGSLIGLEQYRTTTAGDVFKFEVLGTSLRCWINGVLQGYTQSDSTYVSGGRAGLVFEDATGSVTSVTIDNYTAPAATLNQYSFRFFNDDGSESTATAKGALNTNITFAADNVARIRFLIDATNDPDGKQFKLEYRRKPSGGSFGDWGAVS